MESLLQELAALQVTRATLFARVQRSYDEFSQLTVDKVELAQYRYDRMLKLESEFETAQAKIIKLNSKLVPPNNPVEVEAVQSSFETLLSHSMSSAHTQNLHYLRIWRNFQEV